MEAKFLIRGMRGLQGFIEVRGLTARFGISSRALVGVRGFAGLKNETLRQAQVGSGHAFFIGDS